MNDTPEPELLVAIKGLLGPVLTAAIGVFWRRAEEARRARRFDWRRLLLDIPSVLGIGIISGSVALWMELPLLWAMGLACALGHVGTEWLLASLLPRLLDHWFPAKAADPDAPGLPPELPSGPAAKE